MHVARLILTDFRNHDRLELAGASGLMILTGPNGVGKTNVLEALSLLAPGRGLRRAAFAEMARSGGAGGFAVHAALAGADEGAGAVALGTGIDAGQPGRRRVVINGASAAASALPEWLSVLWLTPAMDRLFTDAPAMRRRFLDRMALSLEPGHAHHATRYEAALKARNRLLSDRVVPDSRWLAALEEQLAVHGGALDAGRGRMVAMLQAALAALPDDPDGFAVPRIAMARADGRPGTDAPDGPSGEERAATLRERLHQSRHADRAAGRTLVGPHRDDLRVDHRAKGIEAARCSTGEQKALLLSLILAHGAAIRAQRGEPPMLLLDEVTAHLDPERRRLLFRRLAEGGGQAWLTGTEPGLFEGADGTRVALMDSN